MFTNFAIKSHAAAISCKKILDFSSSILFEKHFYMVEVVKKTPFNDSSKLGRYMHDKSLLGGKLQF